MMHEYKEEIGSRVTEGGKLQAHHPHLPAASGCCSCFRHHREAGAVMKPPSELIVVTLTHMLKDLQLHQRHLHLQSSAG